MCKTILIETDIYTMNKYGYISAKHIYKLKRAELLNNLQFYNHSLTCLKDTIRKGSKSGPFYEDDYGYWIRCVRSDFKRVRTSSLRVMKYMFVKRVPISKGLL